MAQTSERDDLVIREPEPTDFARLAELAGQLGYPSTSEDIVRRLQGLRAHSQFAVFAAERAGQPLAGWICAVVQRTIESDAHVEVTGLIVAEEFRSQGVGEKLLARAEQWAVESGHHTVRVRSNVVRDRAHAFYLRQGYEHYKSQKAFRKTLKPA